VLPLAGAAALMGGETGDVPQPVSLSPLFRSRSIRTTALLGAPLVVLTVASVVGNLLAQAC